jgi:hypothetical protein
MTIRQSISSALVACCLAAASAQGADLPVLRPTALPVDDPYGRDAPDVLSSFGVEVDADVLRQAGPAVGARFVVPLGGGVEVTAVVQQAERVSESLFTVAGSLDDHPFSSFVIAGEGDALCGSFRSIEHGTHALRLTAGGGQVLRRLDPLAQKDCGVGRLDPSASAPAALAPTLPGAFGPPVQAMTSMDTGDRVDILFGYTLPAVVALTQDGYPSKEAHAALAAGDMNYRLTLSEYQTYVLPRLRTVGVEQVLGGATGDTSADLAALKNGDAPWDGLHAARSYYGADLLHVFAFSMSPGLGGLAYRPSEVANLTIDRSYGITTWDGAENSTFAHEVGHNFGCHHHPDDVNAGCGTCPPAGQTDVIQPWAFGHRDSVSFPTTAFRTTMAYEASGHDVVSSFSNPYKPYGISLHLGVVNERDNARLIEETRFYLAQYLPSISFVGPGASPAAGTEANPWASLSAGVSASVPGHEVKLLANDGFTGVIDKHVQLSVADNGPVVIGQ